MKNINLGFFFICTLFIEFINNISYNILKSNICAPINPINHTTEIDDLIKLKFDFNKYNRFINTHFLQNLIYIYESAAGVNSNNSNISKLISRESIIEYKYKAESILSDFNKKIYKVNIPDSIYGGEKDKGKDKYKNNKYSTFKNIYLLFLNYINKYFYFDYNEIFYKNTSFGVIDSITKLSTEIIKVFISVQKFKDFNMPQININFSQESFNINKQKNLTNQQFIIYLFEVIIAFDENLKKLTKNENFIKLCKSNKNYKKQFESLRDLISLRINFIILNNFKDNFLILYGENIRNKLQEFI